MRAAKGAAVTTRGTTAPGTPSEVPTIKRVNGMSATSRMMKGTERPMLTIHPTMVETIRLGRSPFGLVTTRRMPRGIPMTYAKMVATHVMMSVSTVPCKNKWPYWAKKAEKSNMAYFTSRLSKETSSRAASLCGFSST